MWYEKWLKICWDSQMIWAIEPFQKIKQNKYNEWIKFFCVLLLLLFSSPYNEYFSTIFSTVAISTGTFSKCVNNSILSSFLLVVDMHSFVSNIENSNTESDNDSICDATELKLSYNWLLVPPLSSSTLVLEWFVRSVHQTNCREKILLWNVLECMRIIW